VNFLFYFWSELEFEKTDLWSKGRALIRKNKISLSVKLIAPRIPPQSRAIFPTNFKIPPRCPSSAKTATSLLVKVIHGKRIQEITKR
jgi:hypothetical protein